MARSNCTPRRGCWCKLHGSVNTRRDAWGSLVRTSSRPPRLGDGRESYAQRGRNVEISLDSLSYRVEVDYVQNETDEDETGTVMVDFQLSSQSTNADIESHWPELSGSVSYKAPSSGQRAADLADKINDAYTAVGHALMQWSKDVEKRSE